jgi:TolB protein
MRRSDAQQCRDRASDTPEITGQTPDPLSEDPMPYASLPSRRALASWRLRPVGALVATAIAACSEPPTTSAPHVDLPTTPSLAKGVKPAPGIAFSLNGPAGQNVFVIDTAGTRLEQLTHGGLDDEPAWSPDRRKIAFVRGDGPARQIYVKSMNGGRETPIGLGFQPSWSPDGKTIAFTRFAEGNLDVYAMGADGSNVRRLTTDPGGDTEPHWSADGQTIAFTSTRTGTSEIFTMAPDGGAQTRRTFCGPSYYCISPRLSPVLGDSRLVFHQGTYSGSGATQISAIRIIDATGAVVFNLDGGVLVIGEPAWSPDAQSVAYVGTLYGQPRRVIYKASLNGGGLHYFLTPTDADAAEPDWAR